VAIDADLAEIAQLFIEESTEGLDTIESSLLALDVDAVDPDIINEIFRAAHSIKGGGGTFGFVEISEFAHRLETLLDEIRQGERQTTSDIVDLILRAVDCMRLMVDGLSSDDKIDTTSARQVEAEIEALLNGETAPGSVNQTDTSSGTAESTQSEPEIAGWEIEYKPAAKIYRSAVDPLDVLHALAEFGESSIKAKGIDDLDFDTGDPAECALHWHIKLFGDIARQQIDEAFAWSTDDCRINITPILPAMPAGEMLVVAPSNKPPAEKQSAEKPQQVDASQVTAVKIPAKKTATEIPPKKQESGSIRVGIDKVDDLINLVGELVITQSMLGRFEGGAELAVTDTFREGLEQLSRNTRELQESVMQIRMMPIGSAFTRFPRLVRDTCNNLSKKVELVLTGEDTELDKTVLEKIGDPLVHLVRNSLDHGLETPEVRVAAGKSELGTLSLSAFHEGGNIIIEVTDDGAGINREKVLGKAIERGLVQPDDELSDGEIDNLIFVPGFSTVDAVSDLSGRGVGMDVVRRNISDLGGDVAILSSPGRGSTFTIRLPLTLAILDGQLVKVGDHIYIIPLISMIETVQITTESVHSVAGQEDLYKLREQYIQIIRLGELFGEQKNNNELTGGLLVVVEANGQRVGLQVDDLQTQQQVVIKSLETNFKQMQGISGATILGDGKVALILDVRGLIDLSLGSTNRLTSTAAA